MIILLQIPPKFKMNEKSLKIEFGRLVFLQKARGIVGFIGIEPKLEGKYNNNKRTLSSSNLHFKCIIIKDMNGV
jgi:hypothetical protein